MQVKQTELRGAYILEPRVFGDGRGSVIGNRRGRIGGAAAGDGVNGHIRAHDPAVGAVVLDVIPGHRSAEMRAGIG